MQGGMAQVWEANETSEVLDNTSSFGTLVELLASIKGPLVTQIRKGPLVTATHSG